MRLRAGTPQEAGLAAAQIARARELAATWVKQGLTPALAVLVARRGVVALHEAFGQLTPTPDGPALPRSALFPLCSLSKPVTATALMQLVEEGRVGLNRPVAEYIPEFADNNQESNDIEGNSKEGSGKEAVLVHHLLTHTSGLKEDDVNLRIDTRKLQGVSIPAPTAYQHPRVNELLFLGYDTPLWKPPGVEMSYCSYGYDLLGEIVQRVSGEPLADFARARIFAPLGMADTHYCLPSSARGRVVKRPPYAPCAGAESAGWDGLSVYPLRGPKLAWFDGIDSPEWEELPSGAGGVYATALDMAQFGQMFVNRGRYGDARVLSPPTVAAMTRNQIPGICATSGNEFFTEAGWGLGWEIVGDKKPQYDGSLISPAAFAHGGAGGIRLWVDPTYELVVAFFSVVLHLTPDGQHEASPADLFLNAVTAAVDD